MQAIGNQKFLASKLNLMAKAQVKIADELNVEIEAVDRLRRVYLDSKTEGSVVDDIKEDDDDGE